MYRPNELRYLQHLLSSSIIFQANILRGPVLFEAPSLFSAFCIPVIHVLPFLSLLTGFIRIVSLFAVLVKILNGSSPVCLTAPVASW
uniref:Auxin response factor n=1 Tax=Rhizophora mucronata TaxID=61149 RepID=A0A2P2N3L9_RHIMU